MISCRELILIASLVWGLMPFQHALSQAPAQTGSIHPIDPRYLQWGDQGDGTYANPVLNGDFADSDVEKFGDTWYFITSTNHYSPGMTILQSRDLVNWKYTGHAIPSLSWQPEYNWDQMNGYRFGRWAGASFGQRRVVRCAQGCQRNDTEFAWSVDGQQWQTTNWVYQLNFGNWRGNRPGIRHFVSREP